MSDFAHFLPLSNQPRNDESAVSADRRVALATLIDDAARILESVPADAAAAPASAFIRVVRRQALRDRAAGTELSSPVGEALAELAQQVRAGRAQSIKVVSAVTHALLVLGRAVDVAPRIDQLTLGSVALYAASTTSFDRRAVVKGHTIRATDADWRFGHGPVLEATGIEIVRFLLAVSDDAPRSAAKGTSAP